jgi:hypothetical protein
MEMPLKKGIPIQLDEKYSPVTAINDDDDEELL